MADKAGEDLGAMVGIGDALAHPLSLIVAPIGLGVLVVVLLGSCFGARELSRSKDQRMLSCRLRWSHVKPTPDDSIRVAKLCGSDGLKQ